MPGGFSFCLQLSFFYRVDRAHAGARAAIDAFVRVDHINFFALRNAGCGAFGFARAAIDALVVDYIRHDLNLQRILFWLHFIPLIFVKQLAVLYCPYMLVKKG